MPDYKIGYEENYSEKLYNAGPWYLVGLAFQIKANLGKYNAEKSTLVLNSYNSCFDAKKDSKCQFCSEDKKDLFHVQYICQKYPNEQSRLIRHLEAPDSPYIFISLIKSISLDTLKSIHQYLIIICELRNSQNYIMQ